MTAWDKILERMERRVNPHSFSTWFRPTRQEGAANGTIVVRVPSKLFKKRLTETYGQYLQAVLAELNMADTQIDFLCPATEAAPVAAAQPGGHLRGKRAWILIPSNISSIRAICSRHSSWARQTNLRTRRRWPSRRIHRERTTHFSCMAEWEWGRRT
jgi:chromosomal replication initiation ATPase DnaA